MEFRPSIFDVYEDHMDALTDSSRASTPLTSYVLTPDIDYDLLFSSLRTICMPGTVARIFSYPKWASFAPLAYLFISILPHSYLAYTCPVLWDIFLSFSTTIYSNRVENVSPT
jgi:hypothetical protein